MLLVPVIAMASPVICKIISFNLSGSSGYQLVNGCDDPKLGWNPVAGERSCQILYYNEHTY